MTTPPPPSTRTTHGRRETAAHTQMTKPQANALTDLVAQLRPDWQRGAIFNALGENRPYATAAELAAALMLTAANPDARTPQLISHPGKHWDHAPQEPDPTSDTKPGGRKRPCPIPLHTAMGYLLINCPACRKWAEFPTVLERSIFDQLDPQVQHSIIKNGHTRITEERSV